MRKLSAMVVLLGVLGCEPKNETTSTTGEEGRVGFSYRRSCFFGCPVEQPLLTGARERVSLSGPGNAEWVEVASSDTQVLEVALERECQCRRDDFNGTLEVALDGSCPRPWKKACENHVLVEGVAEGDAHLELSDGEGDMLDRVMLHVRDAVSARFSAVYDDRLGADDEAPFELESDSTMEVSVALYDEDGLGILAPEGVRWSSSDEAVAQVGAFLVAPSAELEAGRDVVVHARGEGSADVAIEVPGLEASVEVIVSAP